MKSRHGLALLALLLGIVGGLLLCKGALDAIPRLLDGRGHIDAGLPLLLVIGIAAIIASAMIWKGSYFTCGMLNIVLGIISVFYGRDTEGLMLVISGVLGVAAPKIKD